jgi:hypothetical protein
MSKELWGSKSDPISKELAASRAFFKANRKVISKSFSDCFKIPVTPENFWMIEDNKNIIVADPEMGLFYVNQLSKSQIQFYRTIQPSIIQTDFKFHEEKKIFNDYFEKISLILKTFYGSVAVIYMGQASFSKPLGGFLNHIFTPKLEIFQDNIKIMGVQPRFDYLTKYVEKDERTDVVNLFEGHEMTFINKFIKNINQHAVPENSDIVISLDDDIDDLRRNLSLIGMCLV